MISTKKPNYKHKSTIPDSKNMEQSSESSLLIHRSMCSSSRLHRDLGNSYVQAMAPATHNTYGLGTLGIQLKLKIGASNDRYEQEADRIAEKVMRMPDSIIQGKMNSEENEEDLLQTKSLTSQIFPLVQCHTEPEEEEIHSAAVQPKCSDSYIQCRNDNSNPQFESNIEHQLNSSKHGGKPLSKEICDFMEPRFGANFSKVRVHTDAQSAEMNRYLHAHAFTHGQHIYFSEGKQPHKDELTAHELTHTIQQSLSPSPSKSISLKDNKKSAPAGVPIAAWKAINEYKHPGKVKVRLTIFFTNSIQGDPSGVYLETARKMLKSHGLDLDVHNISTPLSFGTVEDMGDVENLRMLAHKTYQDTRPRLPIFFCSYNPAKAKSSDEPDPYGVTFENTSWPRFTFINANQTSPDGVTLLHEIGHAAELPHVGKSKQDVIENFMTYGKNRTGMTRHQVIGIAKSYFAR